MGSHSLDPDMKISLAFLLLLCLSLCVVDAMNRRNKNRRNQGGRRMGRQGGGGGGGGEDCPGGDELECLRQTIPGEPGQDYPIHPPSFLCQLNPKNPGCPGFGKYFIFVRVNKIDTIGKKKK